MHVQVMNYRLAALLLCTVNDRAATGSLVPATTARVGAVHFQVRVIAIATGSRKGSPPISMSQSHRSGAAYVPFPINLPRETDAGTPKRLGKRFGGPKQKSKEEKEPHSLA